MITPSFSLTATERVLPRLALDFTTASLDSRVTFTRSGNTATVVNSSGLVAPINADLPRFDFDPTTLVCKGLLIEESRINTFTYSEDFGNAAWVRSILNVTINAASSPDGTTNADKLIPTTATGNHTIKQLLALTNGVAYSMSGFFKADGYRRVMLRESTFNGNAAVFDLISGTVISTTSATAAITNFGNGWYRCEMRFTPTWTNSSDMVFFVMPDNGTNYATASFTGDGTSGILAYGAQFEAGAFATSYIPTEATAVTRNADVATMTGANFNWFNASEGAFVATWIQNAIVGNNRWVLMASDNTSNNYIGMLTNPTTFRELVVNGGATQASISNGSITANVEMNGAAAYKADSFAATSNGLSVLTDTSGTVPTVDRLNIGSFNGTNQINGWLSKLDYFPLRLIDAELRAFSN